MSGQVQRTYKEPTGITYTPAVNFTLSYAHKCVLYIINNIVLIECSHTQQSTPQDGVCGDDDGPCLYYYYYTIVRVWFLNETTSKGRSCCPIGVKYCYKL